MGAGRACAAALVAVIAALAVPGAADAFVPGDPLPPSIDNAPQASRQGCADHRSAAGSEVTRTLSAGPQLPDRSLAFVSGLCIYLPPGYAAASKRYPVIYLLHGGGGAQSDWVVDGQIQRTMDDAYRRDPANAAIVVMPDATPLGAWFDRYDGTTVNPQDLGAPRTLDETYVLRWVIPFVDAHFRTIGDRRGRAIAGLSNGGHGAMMLAAKAPDLFAAAGSMDGNVAWLSFGGASEQYLATPPTSSPAPATAGPGMVSPAYREGQLPVNLAENLDGVSLIMDMGAQPYCPPSELEANGCAWSAFEQLFVPGNRDLVAALQQQRHVGALDYRETVGAHEWMFWTTWLAERQLGFLLAHLAHPQPADQTVVPTAPPASFRYRSVAARFSVWGYAVSVQRDVTEFLDLERVTRNSITIRGTGSATVETAARYIPGARYRISGAGLATCTVRADGAGRLTLAIDLGPSHVVEEQAPDAQQLVRSLPVAVPTNAAPPPPRSDLGWVVRQVQIRRQR